MVSLLKAEPYLSGIVLDEESHMNMSATTMETPSTINQDVRIAKESLQRCLGQADFVDIFYDRFLASSDEIKAKFIHTNFPNQKIMLKASLHIMLLLAQGGLKDTKTLQELAERHSHRDLDIHPKFYAYWVNSMLAAVRSCDPEYSPEIGEAWKNALQPGVDFFTSKY